MYPETTSSIRSFIKLSYARLNSCPNHRGPDKRPLGQPLYSRAHWNHSDHKPACPDFLFSSCKNHNEGSGHKVPFSLYLLTDPGASLCGPCGLVGPHRLWTVSNKLSFQQSSSLDLLNLSYPKFSINVLYFKTISENSLHDAEQM